MPTNLDDFFPDNPDDLTDEQKDAFVEELPGLLFRKTCNDNADFVRELMKQKAHWQPNQDQSPLASGIDDPVSDWEGREDELLERLQALGEDVNENTLQEIKDAYEQFVSEPIDIEAGWEEAMLRRPDTG